MPPLTTHGLLGLAFALIAACAAPRAQTLEAVRASHRLECATVQNADDWDKEEVHGDLSALGGEICRAVAAAILGDADAAAVRPLPSEAEALGQLKDGAVQLAVGLSPSTDSAVRFGVGFGPPVFYDSQRVMVYRHSGIATVEDLRDRLICAMTLSPPERTLRDELTARGVVYGLMSHSEQGEMDAAIAVSRCEAGTGMESRLAASRANFHALTSDFVFLPDRWALSPVVPAYRYGDQTFGLIVDWTVHALVEAESLGITKDDAAEAAGRQDMRTEQLLGHDFASAQALGLAHDWAAKAIEAVGNYGEIFERTVGRPYHLERGLNALWTDGGLMAPSPIR